jgi:NAD-dependent dihydropyrimidine dehydrogenase PreA subunit
MALFNSYTQNTLCYDPGLCSGCKLCWSVCPHGVFAPEGGKALVVRQQECMECGACAVNCPTGAIKVASGVGCAAAMIRAAVTGRKEATCG